MTFYIPTVSADQYKILMMKNEKVYYFDVSDAGPRDDEAHWTSDANAFDGDDSTSAQATLSGGETLRELRGEGTSAPGSGGTINSVKISFRASSSGGSITFSYKIFTDGEGETLLSIAGEAVSSSSASEFVHDLSVPSGGWTWAKIQALETAFWLLTGSPLRVYRIRVIVIGTDDDAWENQDNSLLPLGNSRIMSLWSYEDSSDIHIATQQENGRVAYHVFDPGTDAWTTVDEQVAVAGDTNFDAAPTLPAVTMALRADGDVVIVAAYTDSDATPNQRLRVFTRQGSTWANEGAADGAVADTDYSNGIMIGPDGSDRISWTVADNTNDDVDLMSIDSVDAIDGPDEVTATSDTATLLVGPGVIDSANKIYVPYIFSDNQVRTASWTCGTSPAVTVDDTMGLATAAFNGATTEPFPALCLAVDGTDVHLLYSDSSFDLKHNDDVDGGGAGSEDTILAGTINRVSCAKGVTDLLWVVDDNGTTKFGIITLEGVAPSGSGAQSLSGLTMASLV